MLRELTKNELGVISGGISTDLTEVYPPMLPNYYLVGWSEQIIDYRTVEWSEQRSMFTKIIHEQLIPVIEIKPLYAPLIW